MYIWLNTNPITTIIWRFLYISVLMLLHSTLVKAQDNQSIVIGLNHNQLLSLFPNSQYVYFDEEILTLKYNSETMINVFFLNNDSICYKQLQVFSNTVFDQFIEIMNNDENVIEVGSNEYIVLLNSFLFRYNVSLSDKFLIIEITEVADEIKD